MEPTAQPVLETQSLVSPPPNPIEETKYKSHARLAGLIMVFIFLLLIGVTFLVLWYLETQRTGKPPDIQNEAKQLLEEGKKELRY